MDKLFELVRHPQSGRTSVMVNMRNIELQTKCKEKHNERINP